MAWLATSTGWADVRSTIQSQVAMVGLGLMCDDLMTWRPDPLYTPDSTPKACAPLSTWLSNQQCLVQISRMFSSSSKKRFVCLFVCSHHLLEWSFLQIQLLICLLYCFLQSSSWFVCWEQNYKFCFRYLRENSCGNYLVNIILLQEGLVMASVHTSGYSPWSNRWLKQEIPPKGR